MEYQPHRDATVHGDSVFCGRRNKTAKFLSVGAETNQFRLCYRHVAYNSPGESIRRVLTFELVLGRATPQVTTVLHASSDLNVSQCEQWRA
ncbi:jg2097 [Pararge aegeria aegeria]|uniref:Jg2097 protein n=1 Tax=Pararge aegeria aegeria TaxID=348720 RepID=A0A8S4QWT1_9NEOP|nr:jg2097 [Pararge aegeria aegeria]